jgi:WD40 repeat protein
MTDRRQNTPPYTPQRDDTGVTRPETAGPDPSRPGGSTLPPGSTLGGYHIERVLGVGGMGAVYLAADPKLARRVAVKTMKPELAADPAAKERFLREARATAAVEHENVVVIHFVGEDGGTPYLVMPLLKGESLEDRLRRGPVPLGEACRIGREIAAGLAAAHATGLIHRDVKPSNTWLDPDGRVKLLDFGLARPTAAGENLTALGAIVGTPAYMAPEQARGQAVDARADLFSLGCVLYQLATGRRPFTGPTVMAILTSLAVDHPPAADRVNPQVPPELARLIDRLLAKDPAARPASAKEVAGQLLGIEAGLNAGGLRAIPIDAPAGGPDWAALTEGDEASGGRQPPVARQRGRPGEATGGSRPPLAGSPRWPLVIAGLAVLLAVAAAVVLYQQVVKVETPKGTLVIETDDPAVEVVVRKGGATVIDRTTKRAIELAVGDYEIDLAEKKEGLKLSTKRFSLSKGGKETVRVWLEKPKPPKEKPQPVPVEDANVPDPGGPPSGPSPFDALDPAKLPKEERFAGQPKELVAVAGSHRGLGLFDGAPEFSPDGRWIVWQSRGTGGWLLDAATLAVRFRDPNLYQTARAFSPDGKWLALAADPGPDDPKIGMGVRLVDLTGPEPKAVKYLAGRNENGTSAVAFLPDGKTLATGTAGGGLYLWDLTGPGMEPARVIRPASAQGRIFQLAVSADGARLVASEWSGTEFVLRGYDLRPAQPKVVFTLPENWGEHPPRYALSPDGGTLVVLSARPDGKVALVAWDVSGPQPKLTRTAPWSGDQFVAGRFAPDGKSVFLYASSGATEWSVAGGLRKVRDLPAGTVAVRPDGKRVAVVHDLSRFPTLRGAVHDPHRLRLRDAGGKPVADPPPAAVPVLGSGQHSVPVVDGKLVTFADNRIWSVRDGVLAPSDQDAGLFPGKDWGARNMVLPEPAPGGKLLAGFHGGVRVFAVDGTTLRNRAWLPSPGDMPANGIAAFAWHPDGGTIVTLQRDGSFRRWPLVGEKPTWQPFLEPIDPDPAARLAYSPDGKRLAVRTKTSVTVWDLTGEKPTARKLVGPPDLAPLDVAFSPDGRGLFVTYHDWQLVRFDLTRPDDPGRIFSKGGGMWVSPSPGGGRLAAWGVWFGPGRVYAILRVWDFAARAWVAEIRLPDPIWFPHQESGDFPVRWADAGRHLIVPQFGCVYVLRLPPAAAPAADADRTAAEVVLSLGGTVAGRGEGGPFDTGKGDRLPTGPFRLTAAKIVPPKVFVKDGRDDFLRVFAPLTDLATLDLHGMNLQDRNLPPLYGSTSLRSLDLRKNFFTAAGVEKLAAALPKCRIEWNGGTVEPK